MIKEKIDNNEKRLLTAVKLLYLRMTFRIFLTQMEIS